MEKLSPQESEKLSPQESEKLSPHADPPSINMSLSKSDQICALSLFSSFSIVTTKLLCNVYLKLETLLTVVRY